MKAAISKSFSVLFLELIFAAGAFAQAPAQSASAAPATPAATPTADQILDKYVNALGELGAWRKLTSRQSIGTIEIPTMNLSGSFEIHEKAPDSMLSTVIVAGAAFRQGFDGKVGWSDDPQNGVREQSGPELQETRRQADFYHPLDLHKLYTKFTVVGTEKVGDRDAYVVEAALTEGEPDKMYFDTQSGLALRVVSQRHTPQGVISLQEDLEDFRVVDGVKLPFTIHQTAGQNVFTIKITEVHHNVAFGDAQFSKPAAQ
jgi:hypothetical protein